MATTQGISFLHEFDLGNRDIDNPGINILSVTSQASGDFDKANLTTESTRHRWRSSEILTTQEIIIKAEVKSDIDTFALLGHNLTEEAIIQIQANISNNFLAPPVTITVPFQEENIISTSQFGDLFEFYKVKILTNPQIG